jgi:predicted GIY-YIG superfamily endonuclease
MAFTSKKRYNFSTKKWKKVGAVYGVFDSAGSVIYVGSTGNLKGRMAKHKSNKAHCIHSHGPSTVARELVPDKATRLKRESELIDELHPPCNEAS